jgi:serine/threonine protein kinase
MGSSTGSSTWAQHERSTVTREGPVGPRSLINQRFLLEERLGEGGMGVVYKALDRNKVVAEDPRPHVAIKILNEAFRKHPTAFVALQREARKAQELSHPNIVTVHDFDVDETRDGLAYMTMELLDGQELSELIEANRFGGLESEIALSYIADLATALAYAHEKGFVHCDFKPGNVFVTRHGDVKIFDFGIARALPSSLRKGATRDSFDAADLGAYTETYASPEVLDGEPPEQQDDVFALGLVAYELLTGRHPFERLRADKARERKLKPAPVVGISRRRRRALARALAFERDSRQRTAGAFLQEFSPVPVRHWAYAGTAVVALVAAYVGIVEPWIEQWLRAQAFERLPVEQQQAFTTSIEQGRVGLDMGNDGLPAALEFFSRAFEIHPYDARAVAGLEEVADRILAMQLNEDDLRANVRAFYCQEYLATYDGVVRQCGELFGPGTCTDPERVCNGR